MLDVPVLVIIHLQGGALLATSHRVRPELSICMTLTTASFRRSLRLHHHRPRIEIPTHIGPSLREEKEDWEEEEARIAKLLRTQMKCTRAPSLQNAENG